VEWHLSPSKARLMSPHTQNFRETVLGTVVDGTPDVTVPRAFVKKFRINLRATLREASTNA